MPLRRRKSWWCPRILSRRASLEYRHPKENVSYIGRWGIRRGIVQSFNITLGASEEKLKGQVFLFLYL